VYQAAKQLGPAKEEWASLRAGENGDEVLRAQAIEEEALEVVRPIVARALDENRAADAQRHLLEVRVRQTGECGNQDLGARDHIDLDLLPAKLGVERRHTSGKRIEVYITVDVRGGHDRMSARLGGQACHGDTSLHGRRTVS